MASPDLSVALTDALPMLDNLVRRKLVVRPADRHDRVLLTPQGHAPRHQGQLLGQELVKVAGRGLALNQLRTSLAVLAKITQNLAQVEK